MKIDEAIQKARDNENSFKNNHKLNLTLKERSPYYGLDCLRIADDNKHLAEWLEELKAYRENDGISENVYRAGCNFGYNKAIDDFVNALCEGSKQQIELDEGVMCVPLYCKAQFCEGNCNDCVAEIRKIAEQLKGEKTE